MTISKDDKLSRDLSNENMFNMKALSFALSETRNDAKRFSESRNYHEEFYDLGNPVENSSYSYENSSSAKAYFERKKMLGPSGMFFEEESDSKSRYTPQYSTEAFLKHDPSRKILRHVSDADVQSYLSLKDHGYLESEPPLANRFRSSEHMIEPFPFGYEKSKLLRTCSLERNPPAGSSFASIPPSNDQMLMGAFLGPHMAMNPEAFRANQVTGAFSGRNLLSPNQFIQGLTPNFSPRSPFDKSIPDGYEYSQVCNCSNIQEIQAIKEALLSISALRIPKMGQDEGSFDLLEMRRYCGGSESPNSHASSNPQSPNSLYKTELCQPWEETGTCRYGPKCQFAHGKDELRSVPRHPKYKTEFCRTYNQNGTCPYGKRCRFIHGSTAAAAAAQFGLNDSENTNEISRTESIDLEGNAELNVEVSENDLKAGGAVKPIERQSSGNCGRRLPIFQDICP